MKTNHVVCFYDVDFLYVNNFVQHFSCKKFSSVDSYQNESNFNVKNNCVAYFHIKMRVILI
jgi:hypothetical protein